MKKAYLEMQAWLEVYLRLVYEASIHPSVLRLGLVRGQNLELERGHKKRGCSQARIDEFSGYAGRRATIVTAVRRTLR